MKSKISPTSPKAKINNNQELDQLYKDNLKTIERPQKRGLGNIIGLLVLIVFFGFLTGVLGQILLLSYGSEIPFLNKLTIFSYPVQPSFIIGSGKGNKILSVDQVDKIVKEVSPSVVQIYEAAEVTDNLDSLYLPSNALGCGLILTDDGYLVADSQSIGERENLVVITQDNRIFNVDKIINDEASGYSFLNIDANNLKTVTLAGVEGMQPTQDIIVIQKLQSNQSPVIIKSSILNTHYYSAEYPADLIRSTEKFYRQILINGDIRTANNFSIVFTLQAEAIGILNNSDGENVIMPFEYFDDVIDQVLVNKTIKRVYLGVSYLDLSEALNISDTLSQKYDAGALVYPKSEEEPAVAAQSPALKSGLLENDIIISVDNIDLNEQNMLNRIILNKNSGEFVDLEIIRDGEEKNIKVTLENK
ncbi:S1C family serine protease [Patescibacteria group bacterium]|nr:S1C family serine protease [Patescibacteria group bacterium]